MGSWELVLFLFVAHESNFKFEITFVHTALSSNKLEYHVSFNQELPYLARVHFVNVVCSNLWSYPFKGHVFRNLSFEHMQNLITHCLFDQMKYLLWSFPSGRGKRSNIDAFSEHIIIHVSNCTLLCLHLFVELRA